MIKPLLEQKGRWYFGLAFLIMFSVQLMMLVNVEPVRDYFTAFIWWSYIFAVDGFLYWRKGTSPITRLKVKFPLLVLISACFWEVFELVNSRIDNWEYVGHSFSFSGSVVFGVVAFGSVLPGIIETHEFLRFLRIGTRLEKILPWERWSRILHQKWWGYPQRAWMLFGILLFLAGLVLPTYFFWAVWVGPIMVMDPLVERWGGQGLAAELRRGEVHTFFRLIATGFLCGVLWETWNYWAGIKWVYEVPIPVVGEWKIFEMPFLGYFGFPVFAIVCYLFCQLLSLQYSRLKTPHF